MLRPNVVHLRAASHRVKIIISIEKFETKVSEHSRKHLLQHYLALQDNHVGYSRSPWVLLWFWSFAVIFGYRRDQRTVCNFNIWMVGSLIYINPTIH